MRKSVMQIVSIFFILGGFFTSFAFDELAEIPNAILEGVQISSEAGTKPGEKVVSCYFIFRDKPSSFFYEIREKEKLIVFEFNDTKKSSSPIPPISEPPITNLTVEEKRINVNKEIKGLNPEWHDLLVAKFKVEQIPFITVNEEYNIISFTYKWSSDPAMVSEYVVKNKRKLVIPISLGVVGATGGAILAAYINKINEEKDTVAGPLSIDDLPVRTP